MRCDCRHHCVIVLLGLYVILLQGLQNANCSPVAEDIASDPAYAADPTGAWRGLNSTSGENPNGNDNGGYGFNTWDFAGGYHDPQASPYGDLNHFIDGVDFPTSSYNNLGEPAFGLTNGNRPFFGYTARATRTFAPLAVGATLSVDFDNPLLQPLDQFASSGFLFRLNTGGGPVIDNGPIPGVHEKFGFVAASNFNDGRWYVTDAQNSTDTGIADADTASGARFQFSRTGEETYFVKLSRLSDNQTLFARSGMLLNSGKGDIDTLEISMYGNGSGGGTGSNSTSGQREFFFNNLLITSGGSNLAGDFDFDGDVDGHDFMVWQRGDSPNSMSSSDLAEWKKNYTASAPLWANSIAVPEPQAILLVVFASLSVIVWRRRPLAVRDRHRPA